LLSIVLILSESRHSAPVWYDEIQNRMMTIVPRREDGVAPPVGKRTS